MKRFCFVVCLVWTLNAQAQITLEHSYPQANTGGTNRELSIGVLDSGMYKYLYLNYLTEQLVVYNLDHSVFASATIPIAWDGNYRIQYVTRSLFDCDTTNMEYIMAHYDFDPMAGIDVRFVRIYRFDGTVLFEADSVELLASFGSVAFVRSPIVTTPAGSKLLLDNPYTHEVNVYALCGMLPIGFMDTQNENLFAKALPNPSSGRLRIDFNLPEGHRTAVITVHDARGVEVKRFSVDDKFGFVWLEGNALPPGTYVYNITTSAGTAKGGKFVIAR